MEQPTKFQVDAVQFSGSNVKDLEAFGATIIQVNKTTNDYISLTDNRSLPLLLKKGDWLIKNQFGILSKIPDEDFQKSYQKK